MGTYANPMLSRDRKSATQLVTSENSLIEFVNHDKTLENGQTVNITFFTCGTKTGYLSPKAQAYINGLSEDEAVDLNKLRYADCSKDGGKTWVPVLMTVSGNVIKTAGADLLR